VKFAAVVWVTKWLQPQGRGSPCSRAPQPAKPAISPAHTTATAQTATLVNDLDCASSDVDLL